MEIVKINRSYQEYLSEKNHLSQVAGQTVSPNLAGLFNNFTCYSIKTLFEGGPESEPLADVKLKDISTWGEVVLWEGYWLPLEEVKFIAKIIEENYTPAMRIVWGYVDGRVSHLGPLAAGGNLSASMYPGYQIWVQLYKI